ncbi:MAG: HelD family protein [Brevundimonas sp.]|uniref:HelD family protein n=1 Tax=Brevundimonas sp. TaxID=1871086 RepID=UPI00391BCD2A
MKTEVQAQPAAGVSAAAEAEGHRLEACHQAIRQTLAVISSRLTDYAREIRETKEYMWEARRDLDHIDKIAMHQVIEQKSRSAEVLADRRKKLGKTLASPYFGRFDFARDVAPDAGAEPFYVGIHDFRDEESGDTWVHDWRAPISSVFYDFETGPAHYDAPGGEVKGRVALKRQFRIKNGRMELMLDTGVNIVDDVLQDELGRASDDGMKNIVATIQRDQNAIVRDADVHTLIIQGVAGSGKTSIALHRIAFLLYRFKETLASKDILIISPNRVFADYIGNVLPELGEEQVREIGMETLADDLLEGKHRFQTFFEQAAQIYEGGNEGLNQRIAVKGSLAFLEQIDAYVEHLEARSFEAVSWRSGTAIVPDWHLAEAWQKHRGLSTTQRIAEVVGATEHKIYLHYRRELRTDERKDLRQAVRSMARPIALKTAYKGLFDWLDQPELYRPKGAVLEYADVFPLIHLKMRLGGLDNPHRETKHLLIDEMQDYTPVQYAVLAKLFPCKKTILGDATQAVNPFGASAAEDIQKILRATAPVKLQRSYRSTWEIMQFALGVSPNPELIPMKRHGEAPEVLVCAGEAQAAERLHEELQAFETSDHRSLAIIVKTQKQARKLHDALVAKGDEVRLLDVDSTDFSTGAVICTAHLAKGLEFDRVVIPDASARVYQTDLDRNLLYVACTRAMHRLTVISPGAPSPLLPEQV